MRTILIILSEYLPATNPNVLRWKAILELWAKNHNIHIVTTRLGGQAKYSKSSNIHIHRTGHNTLRDWLHNITGRSTKRNLTNKNYTPTSGWIERLVDILWRKYYWPDGSVFFLKPGKTKILSVIETYKVDTVISVGLPYTSHLIGYNAKTKFPDIRWHMDVQDPFSISDEFWVNNFGRYAERNNTSEQKLLALADSITFTNEEVLDIYNKQVLDIKSKAHVIPPLFQMPIKSYSTKLRKENTIKIAYFGMFYEGVRSSKRLKILIENLGVKNQQFYWIGQHNRDSAQHLSHLISSGELIHLGYQDRNIAITMMQEMNVVINFGNTTKYHLPSKLVDILYLNKPTIACKINRDDSSERFLSKERLDTLFIHDENNPDFKKLQAYIIASIKLTPKVRIPQQFLTEKIQGDYASILEL